MTITPAYAKEKIQLFNALYFNGELPEVPVLMSNARSFVGRCEFKRLRLPLRGEKKYDFRLRFSRLFDLSPDEWDDTILHEMIHLWIGVKGIRDTSTHGKVFRQMMDDLNSKHGRNITISHKSAPGEATAPARRQRKTHLVAIVTLKDGRRGIKIIPKSERSIRLFRRGMMYSGMVKSLSFRLSANPYFNRFPSSTALKVYFPPQDELDAALAGSIDV